MTSLPPDAWVPVPVRWRHVLPGDVIAGRDGALWLITVHEPNGMVIAARSFRKRFTDHPDPDETVHVLVPATEREAVELTREQLGARLIERRTS